MGRFEVLARSPLCLLSVAMAIGGGTTAPTVAQQPGLIITVAGQGTAGYRGDEGPAVQARLSAPGGVAVDAQGNVYIGDGDNNRIRQLAPDGMLSTFAGSGPTGFEAGSFAGDGGPALNAHLSETGGIAVGLD